MGWNDILPAAGNAHNCATISGGDSGVRFKSITVISYLHSVALSGLVLQIFACDIQMDKRCCAMRHEYS